MALLLLIGSYFEPDVTKLGSEDFQVREYWSGRYENVLSALLLPKGESDDPEVRARVARIRVKARWFDTVYWERVTRSRDWELWLRVYVVHGESRIETLRETYEVLRSDSKKARVYMDVTQGQKWLPTWLCGIALPNEYQEFCFHRMLYRHKLMFWPVAHSPK